MCGRHGAADCCGQLDDVCGQRACRKRNGDADAGGIPGVDIGGAGARAVRERDRGRLTRGRCVRSDAHGRAVEAVEHGCPARDGMDLVRVGRSVDGRGVAVRQRCLRGRRQLGIGAAARAVHVVTGEVRRRGRRAPGEVDTAGRLLDPGRGARCLRSLVDVERVVAIEPARSGEAQAERSGSSPRDGRRGGDAERGGGAGGQRDRSARARREEGRRSLWDRRKAQRRGSRRAADVRDPEDVGEGSGRRYGAEVDGQPVHVP